jgi:diketogulonate reductase-like aldo/keto reductase
MKELLDELSLDYLDLLIMAWPMGGESRAAAAAAGKTPNRKIDFLDVSIIFSLQNS